LKKFFECLGVDVWVDESFGAREFASVDDTSVVEFIGEDEIAWGNQCTEGAEIGAVAGWEDDCCGGILPMGDCLA
jgi:hypothetical protein